MADRTGVLLVGEPMGLYMAQQEGHLDEVSSFSIAVAGAELNVAIGISRLGHKVSYLTKLGTDFHAKIIERLMHDCGISTEFTSFSAKRPTGIMFKSLVPGGDPEIFYLRKNSAASTLSPADIEGLDFSEYSILHMTGIMPALSSSTREASWKLLEEIRKHDMLFSFDPNLRPQLWPDERSMVDFMNSMAAQADYFLPGIAEARILMGEPDATPEDATSYYRRLGARTVIVKCGARGAYFDNGSESGWGGTFRVKSVVDTVGAGDGFAAGVLTATLEGLSLPECVTRGNAVGSMQVQVRGDNEGLPSREQLEEYMARARIA